VPASSLIQCVVRGMPGKIEKMRVSQANLIRMVLVSLVTNVRLIRIMVRSALRSART